MEVIKYNVCVYVQPFDYATTNRQIKRWYFLLYLHSQLSCQSSCCNQSSQGNEIVSDTFDMLIMINHEVQIKFESLSKYLLQCTYVLGTINSGNHEFTTVC